MRRRHQQSWHRHALQETALSGVNAQPTFVSQKQPLCSISSAMTWQHFFDHYPPFLFIPVTLCKQRVQYVKWLSETLSSSLRSAAYCQVLTKMCLHCKRTRTITVQRTMPLTHSQMTARMKQSIVAGNTVLVSTGSANGGNWSVTIQTNCKKTSHKVNGNRACVIKSNH
jgi:hypothetical protein